MSQTGQRTAHGSAHRRVLFPVLVCLSILVYSVFFAWLSILRHQTFQSNAMDLGYTDQVLWNTLHGRFMQFSTLQAVPIDLSLDQFRRTDILLAYHVELILVPLSLLYLVFDSPIALLVAQTLIIGLGALPAFWIARDHLDSGFAGLAFALAYLMAPAIGGANLSDFHGVSLTASLLLFALYWLQRRRYKLYFGTIVLCMLAKEDIPLLLVTMGVYIALCRREPQAVVPSVGPKEAESENAHVRTLKSGRDVSSSGPFGRHLGYCPRRKWVGVPGFAKRKHSSRVGILTALLGLGWFLVCTQVILPHYNGLPASPFFHRVTIFGPTLKDSLLNIWRDPLLLVRWLIRPEVVRYVVGLLASTGFTSLFSPLTLGISAPIVAMNVFSTWDWTYSEGAHYSASIVPFVILSGIYGTDFLARQLSNRTPLTYRHAVHGLAAIVLLVSGIHHYRIGISPWSRSYHPIYVTAHHRLGHELINTIPTSAPISAQSGLYPHLAHRERAYFFPAIKDAEYVLLDVTGPSYPITIAEVRDTAQRLLRSGEFGVMAAEDGYLLLQRGMPNSANESLPAEFYTFAQVDVSEVEHPLPARFGDTIELLGYDYAIANVVHAAQLPAVVTTYWRALQPLHADESLVLFFSRQDGAIVYHYEGPTAATVWFPLDAWPVGEVVRVQTPALSVGRLHEAMVAVVTAQGDPWSMEDRLTAIGADDDHPVQVYEQGTLLKLFDLP